MATVSTPKSARKRVYHELDTPFSTVEWPTIEAEDQDAIVELLCNLLSPLGQHRRRHVKPSKGKWARRKERKARKASQGDCPQTTDPATPPAPELSRFVNVGLPGITRHLQELAALPPPDETADGTPQTYAAVFVVRDGQSSAFWSHVPQMVAVAAQKLPPGQQTRLVALPESCGPRLCACLAIPRASSVGVKIGAPGAAALFDYVNKSVPEVDVAWLKEAAVAEFRATKINPIETVVGAKRVKKTSRLSV